MILSNNKSCKRTESMHIHTHTLHIHTQTHPPPHYSRKTCCPSPVNVVPGIGLVYMQEAGERPKTGPHLDVGGVVACLQASAVFHHPIQGVQHLPLAHTHILAQGAAVGGQVQHHGEVHVTVHLPGCVAHLYTQGFSVSVCQVTRGSNSSFVVHIS